MKTILTQSKTSKLLPLIIGILIGSVVTFYINSNYIYAKNNIGNDENNETYNSLKFELIKKDFTSERRTKGILKKSFENKIDAFIATDPEFHNYYITENKAFMMDSIKDEFFEAYRKIYYNAAIDVNRLNIASKIDNTKSVSKMNDKSWVWISTEDLANYVEVLRNATFMDSSINGTRIYLGLIDTNYLDPAIVANNYEYYKNKHGAFIPLFAATYTGPDGKLYDSEFIAKYDCNCGNPPNFCLNNELNKCIKENRCEKCPRLNVK